MEDSHREAGMPPYDNDDERATPLYDDDRVVVQEEVSFSRAQAHLLDRQAGWAALVRRSRMMRTSKLCFR